MSRRKKQFISGMFELSGEHIELASSRGISEVKLVTDYLHNIEIDHALLPNTLVVYYGEYVNGNKTFWYTEVENGAYVQDFEINVLGFGKVLPTLN